MRESRFILILLAVCSISHFVIDGYLHILSPLSTLILNDFQLNYTQLGLLISGFLLSASILQFIAGYLSLHISKKSLIVVSFLWASIFVCGAAMASNYLQLLILLVAAGIGISFYHPTASSIVSKAFPRRGRGGAISIYLFSGRVGAFSSVLLANIIASMLNWRLSMYMWAVNGLIVALISASANIEDREELIERRPMIKLGRWRFSRKRSIFGLVFTYATYKMLSGGLTAFVPVYLVENLRISTTYAGFSVGLLIFCGSVGSILIGLASHRLDNKRVVLLLVALSAILVFLMTTRWIGIYFVVNLALLGVAVYSISPLTQTLVSEYTLPSERTRVFGFFFTIGDGLGAITPMLMGAIADAHSLNMSFYLLVAVTCIGTASMLSLR